MARTPTIYYFCPDMVIKSAGIRTLYRQVGHLNRNGLSAFILHQNAGFVMPDAPPTPVRYLNAPGTLVAGDIVAIPEGWPNLMQALKDQPLRKVAIAQNWSYVYKSLPLGVDWRHLNIERILTYPDHTGEFLNWAMRLPTHVFDWGIRDDLYYPCPEEKQPQITYIKRKEHNVEVLQRVLCSRNPAFVQQIRWLALHDLSEPDYAREIRRSRIFLSLSTTEGLYAPYFEAMRSGTLVAGYNAVGAQRALHGSGPEQNCILAENEDYIALAYRLEPLLDDLLRGDLSRFEPVLQNGFRTAEPMTMAREEQTIVAIWREILAA